MNFRRSLPEIRCLSQGLPPIASRPALPPVAAGTRFPPPPPRAGIRPDPRSVRDHTPLPAYTCCASRIATRARKEKCRSAVPSAARTCARNPPRSPPSARLPPVPPRGDWSPCWESAGIFPGPPGCREPVRHASLRVPRMQVRGEFHAAQAQLLAIADALVHLDRRVIVILPEMIVALAAIFQQHGIALARQHSGAAETLHLRHAGGVVEVGLGGQQPAHILQSEPKIRYAPANHRRRIGEARVDQDIPPRSA